MSKAVPTSLRKSSAEDMIARKPSTAQAKQKRRIVVKATKIILPQKYETTAHKANNESGDKVLASLQTPSASS